MTEPITSDEHMAALAAFNAASDDTPKSELRELLSQAVEDVRGRSGRWEVYAESYDFRGTRLISTHDSEAEALTECRRLNREYPSDAGSYGWRPIPSTSEEPSND